MYTNQSSWKEWEGMTKPSQIFPQKQESSVWQWRLNRFPWCFSEDRMG